MTYENILVEIIGKVGVVTLNRPRALNALNRATIEEGMAALKELDGNPEVGAIVLTGSERVFAAGADIKEMMDKSALEMHTDDPIAPFDEIIAIKTPVIAAVSGWCLGGGCELAMSCDMIVASESAVFGQPEINLGVIPGAGGTQRLTRAVGKAIAMEMVLNDRKLSADEALAYGLVNRVVPVERYLQEALELAAQVAAKAPLAVETGKRVVNRAFDAFLKDGLIEERKAFYDLFDSHDQAEGMQAFNEKRAAEWKGK